MPIIAAPLEAMAVLGEFIYYISLAARSDLWIGFVLAGIPVYYITQRPAEGPIQGRCFFA